MSKYKTFEINNILYYFEFLILNFGVYLKFIIWYFLCKNF
mgnify:CR=1 FL=1